MASEYKIGSSYGGLTSLDTAGIIADPRSTYRPYADSITDANGLTIGVGFPVVEWHWDVMRVGEAELLYAFVTGLSGNVYIRTKLARLSSSNYQYGAFSCVMHWPTGDEDIQAKRPLGLTILFTNLVTAP